MGATAALACNHWHDRRFEEHSGASVVVPSTKVITP